MLDTSKYFGMLAVRGLMPGASKHLPVFKATATSLLRHPGLLGVLMPKNQLDTMSGCGMWLDCR